jgi:UDP-GlcNAc:undecaprenyl-phosphate/decaprenyl-phosphate GlcNAc-1-phosphate transferase
MQFSVGPFAILATMFIVLGFVNGANLADGINGQLLGSVAIWCGFLLIYAPSQRTPFLVLLSSTLVALFFNLRGKVFSGSVGSYALSLFIGMSTIALYRRSNGAFHADLPVYWFWLPVVDCLRLFAWRALNNRSPLSADRGHIHHVLTRLVGGTMALPVYLSLLALPGVVAIFRENLGALALIGCFLVYFLLLGLESEKVRTHSAVFKAENA